MREHTMTNELTCTWRTVTDADGRAHMEACWAPAATATAKAAHAA